MPLTLAAVIAVPLGVVTCFLLSRAATAAFASFLASRRFRDLAFVAIALVGVAMAIVGNLIGTIVSTEVSELRDSLADLATVAGWSPFGWAWAIPADVSRGGWRRGDSPAAGRRAGRTALEGLAALPRRRPGLTHGRRWHG